jgi:hypothetical protein
MEQDPQQRPEEQDPRAGTGPQEGAPAGGPEDPPAADQNPLDTDNPEDNPPLPRVWH